jgi:hypothetical protein
MGSDPSTGDGREYLEMAYGLYNAFFLEKLPDSLDSDDMAEAARLCEKMTAFMMSGRCLKWVEMAIIFNYDIGSDALIHYAYEAIQAAEQGIKSSFQPFSMYSIARKQFFADWAYVLSVTGPIAYSHEWDEYGWVEEPLVMPEGFTERRLALELLSVGERWKHLSSSSILY